MKRPTWIRGQSVVRFLTVVMFILLLIGMAEAKDFCVDDAVDLQSALTEAANNNQDDVIRIVQGTYDGNFVYTSSEPNSLTIEGGYTPSCAGMVVDPTNTVLDAGGSGAVLVLSAPGVAADFVVDGVTVQNGNVNINGGGLYAATNGIVTLTNNTICNSNAFLGGGIYFDSYSGTVTLTNNTISDNSATQGGGIFLQSSLGAITLINNSINYNSANSDAGGAFLRSGSGVVTLINNSINYNSSQFCGGAIFLPSNSHSVILSNNTIKNNIANFGGGVFYETGIFNETDTGTVTLSNNTISYNNSTREGGGIYFFSSSGTVTLTNNTISDNSAEESGGGVWLRLIYDGDDGAIANIYNNIIWNNGAGNEGRDLYIENDGNNDYSASTVNLYNNDFDQTQTTGTYIQLPFPIDPSNLNNIDPQFVDPPNEDYHLSEGSPCINAGDSSAPELPATDKDGLPRIVGSSVDIGAYEYQGFIAPIAAFMASPLVGVAPLIVNFTDQSTGTIKSWSWDFGDGNTSTLQNPTNTYNVVGTYSVSLTVTGDSVSDEETKTDYITVVSPDAPDLSGACEEFHSYEFGQRIVMKVQIKNTGIEKANPFEVAFYLSDSVATLGDFIGQESINGGLNSGHDKTVSFRYESQTPLSGKYLRAVIDLNQQVLELDETNNEVSIRIP